MKVQHGALHIRTPGWRSRVGFLCAASIVLASPTAGNVYASGRGSHQSTSSAPESRVLTYFADLAAHRYYAAHLLEAPCSHAVRVANSPGSPPGLAVFRARSRWLPGTSRVERQFIREVRVTGIVPYHNALFTRGRMPAFRVYGHFSFARPRSQAGQPNEPTTLTKLTVATWQCGSQWWVDPQWLVSSRMYSSRADKADRRVAR